MVITCFTHDLGALKTRVHCFATPSIPPRSHLYHTLTFTGADLYNVDRKLLDPLSELALKIQAFEAHKRTFLEV